MPSSQSKTTLLELQPEYLSETDVSSTALETQIRNAIAED